MARSVAEEAAWLAKHPHFRERPATLLEFLGSDYLNIESKVRNAIKVELAEIIGHDVSGERPTAYQLAMITGGIGIGKQLRHDAPVLTPKGWRPISSLSVGDEVTGSDGKATVVVGVFPQGKKALFRVAFTDGSSVDAGAEHQWAVRTRSQEYKGKPYRVMTTQQITDDGLRSGDGWKWRIPLVKPVEFDGVDCLPVDPYTLGALLGDGCFTRRTVTLAGDDLVMADRIAPSLPASVTLRRGAADRDWRFSGRHGQPNEFVASLESLGYQVGIGGTGTFQKFVPESYMMASPAARLELLRGLMDTDGCVMGDNGTVFSNSNLHLCEQIVALVRSLGGTASMTNFDRRGTTEYQVHVNLGDVCPFWLPRKVERWKPRTNRKPTRAIKSIEYIDDDEAYCISVDAPDHLYVTKDFIVTHNTTIASIVLPYLVHWCLCLKDPQDFFGLLPGSRIAFMQMSTSEQQAKEVVFGDIKARIEHSVWFKKFPWDPTFKNQFRFQNDIWIIPGDSAETTFEGYNILGGILDEADSHKVTKNTDYAEQGFKTIYNRMSSRFEDRGFVLVIGQMKKAIGFAARKYADLKRDPKAYAVRMTIWESRGDEYFRCKEVGPHGLNPRTAVGEVCGAVHKFAYDTHRKQILPCAIASEPGFSNVNLIWVPEVYRPQFETNPETALKDLAGIPPAVGSPFISLVHKIHDARDRWIERYGDASPVDPDGRIAEWFHAKETLKRAAHVDIGYADDGDAMGIAMGHVPEMIVIDGERKPFIVIDFLMRMTAPAGGEIFLGDMRHVLYNLRGHFGFRLETVTLDGFQCFTGDTAVPLLDGRTLTMKELAEQHPNGGVWTYSYNGKKIRPGYCSKAWKTGVRRVVEVQLDNGEKVRCTPDHRWMLRDGSYRMASELCPGDSLMPLYRRVTPRDWTGLKGYEQVLQPGKARKGDRYAGLWCTGRWQYTHCMTAGPLPRGWTDHHIDFNKLNNDPGNLSRMTQDDHLALHRCYANGRFDELWQDPAFRAKTSAAVSRSNTERTGMRARRRRHDITIADIRPFAHLGHREAAAVLGCSQDVLYARVREAGYASWYQYRKVVGEVVKVNHKVVAVVDHGEIEDVYDIQVEDHHNFALAAGVFVHNSQDTLQQLGKRRFQADYLSMDRQLLPYHDLREAVYEDRIAIPPYMVHFRPGDTELVEVAVKELMELVDNGTKVDHPDTGSKDVADAIAGVTFTLMGDRRYHKKVRDLDQFREQRQEKVAVGGLSHPAYLGDNGLTAPLPPVGPTGWRR